MIQQAKTLIASLRAPWRKPDSKPPEMLQAADMLEALVTEQKSVWVLTCEHNLYDQMGEYFVAVFKEKPTHVQLSELGVETNTLRHVLNGGGRKKYEDVWYNLNEHKV